MVSISDCTLRDARHAPGMAFTPQEAAQIAAKLDSLGIEEIEAGILSGSSEEREILHAVASSGLNADISALCLCYSTRVIEDSLDFAVDCGVNVVCLSIPSSQQFIETKLKRSYRAVRSLLEKAVKEAVARGLVVAFSGEDAARGDLEQLVDYVNAGADAGASRFRFAESVSCLTPSQMADKISALKAKTSLPLEVHCHSAYGLGVANSVAAIEAGAEGVSVTIDGIGERGGNTPLAPLLLYLYHFKKQQHYRPQGLKKLSDYVNAVTKNGAQRFAPIVGDCAFHYEYLHQYQLADLYESYQPELVGNRKELVFGMKFDKHSYEDVLNLDSVPEELRERVVSKVLEKRQGLTAAEMKEILGAIALPDASA
jgi:isopropylmalate/homocitrate/citramalate synthase